MKSSTLFLGMLKGMKEMGAELADIDDTHLYFYIKEGSLIDDEEVLKRAKEGFMLTFGMGIKIKKVKEITNEINIQNRNRSFKSN